MKELTKLEKTVIDNIRKIRKEKGISQIRLAAYCDTSASYIGLMESYKNIPKLSTIEKIAEALNISPIELFKESTDLNLNGKNIKKENIERIKIEILNVLNNDLENILKQLI